MTRTTINTEEEYFLGKILISRVWKRIVGTEYNSLEWKLGNIATHGNNKCRLL